MTSGWDNLLLIGILLSGAGGVAYGAYRLNLYLERKDREDYNRQVQESERPGIDKLEPRE